MYSTLVDNLHEVELGNINQTHTISSSTFKELEIIDETLHESQEFRENKNSKSISRYFT